MDDPNDPTDYYVVESSGNVTITPQCVPQSCHDPAEGDTHVNWSTERDYMDLAFEFGGATWDLRPLRSGNSAAIAAFKEAFVSVLSGEITEAPVLDVRLTDATVQ